MSDIKNPLGSGLHTTDELRDRSYAYTGKGQMMYAPGVPYAKDAKKNNEQVMLNKAEKFLSLPERKLGRWRGTAIYAAAGVIIMMAGVLLTPVFGLKPGDPWRSLTVMLGFVLFINAVGIALGSPEKRGLMVLFTVIRAWLVYESIFLMIAAALTFLDIPPFPQDVPIWQALGNQWNEFINRTKSLGEAHGGVYFG